MRGRSILHCTRTRVENLTHIRFIKGKGVSPKYNSHSSAPLGEFSTPLLYHVIFSNAFANGYVVGRKIARIIATVVLI